MLLCPVKTCDQDLLYQFFALKLFLEDKSKRKKVLEALPNSKLTNKNTNSSKQSSSLP